MKILHSALILLLFVTIAFCETVASLPASDRESGIVTRREIGLAQNWFDAVTQGSQDRASWVGEWVSSAVPFSFRYGGGDSRTVLKTWKLDKREPASSEGVTNRRLVWTDESTGLQLTWDIKRFTDFPAVEWVLAFENHGTKDTLILEDIQAMDLRLNHTGPGEYTVHGVAGGRSMPDDMTPYAIQIPAHDRNRRHTQLGGDFPSSNRHLPFFNLESPDGRGVLLGVGWSGNWLARLEVDDSQLRARTGLKTTHFVLHPGEHVRTARILAMFWEGQRLHSNNMWRQLLLTKYVPKLHGKLQQPMVAVNVCFTYKGYGAFLHEAAENTVEPLIKPFHDLGAELFILDAGWYDGAPWHQWLGNWVYSKTKYPNGFRPVSDQLKADRMIFGLWFASENLSSHAPLLQEHPEWVRTRTGGGDLRMEIPKAREWFLNRVDDFANHQGVGCYRQDGSARFGEEPADRTGITESEHIEGLYKLWDEIKRRHPDMVMEGCSGGGRRVDLETVSRFHWHQKSDRWYDSESDQGSLCGANFYLPGGTINIPTMATDDYGAWSSFGGQFSLGWDPIDPAFPMAKAKQQVGLYKRIRPLLSGDYYPMTGCALENTWIAYQFHRRDLNSGFALIFRRSSTDRVAYPVNDTFQIRLRGLRPDATYRVSYQSSRRQLTMPGNALMTPQDLTIAKGPAAEMIIYEAQK